MKMLKLLPAVIIFTLIGMLDNRAVAQDVSELRLKTESITRINKVSIYPNPTTDFVNISIENANLNSPTIEVYNILGNSMKVNIESIDRYQFKIEVEDLPMGYYLVMIRDDLNHYKKTYKFLKK